MKRVAVAVLALAAAGCAPQSRPGSPAAAGPARVDVTRGLADIREEGGRRWSTVGNVSAMQRADGGWSISRDRAIDPSDHARILAGNGQLVAACRNALPDWPEAADAVAGIWAHLRRQPAGADRFLSFPRCGYGLTFTADEFTEVLSAVPMPPQ